MMGFLKPLRGQRPLGVSSFGPVVSLCLATDPLCPLKTHYMCTSEVPYSVEKDCVGLKQQGGLTQIK